ncbi:fungal-specific transcription factor domain-containing protein [Xylariales sp. PMI_506]|nr:fungal-specific transcription factor domain-containing protein [Xylariales sp. PMI_506]
MEPSQAVTVIQSSPAATQTTTLSDELRLLSLEAAAERHLGSSSGVSFAKLTQAVLRRLTPDQADFVFVKESDVEEPPSFMYDLPTELLTSSGFQGLGGVSPSPFQGCLFGEISLSDITEPPPSLVGVQLPSETHLRHLVDFYFAHSHTLYPIVRRREFNIFLNSVIENPQDLSTHSPLALFRLWMILAIGSTTYCAITLVEESESMLYYNKALGYMEDALGYGDMVALEVIMLQVSYSFFNQLGPNTWFLVGLAARLAVGMGLHTSATYDMLPVDVAESRKRIFYSIYMMDRVVSIALGRPFALHDDDIDVEPFIAVDDEEIHMDGINPQNPLQPSIMAVPLHILRLRLISSKIAKLVYSNKKNANKNLAEREEVIRALHRELVEWRRDMPFPLPDIHSKVPHLSSTWYDFNYYTHIAMLYRPSPLFPTLDQSRVRILGDAASMAIRQAIAMHRQNRFAYNWLNLLGLFTSALSLVYATTAQPESLVTALREGTAIEDLQLAVELFTALSLKFPAAKNVRRMIEEIVTRYRELCAT